MCQDHSLNSISHKVHNYDFRLNASISIFLTQITSYFFIECFNSYGVFWAAFLLEIPFLPLFYISFIFNICCTKSEIQIFVLPMLFLQLKYNLLIYRSIKCVYTNYIVHIRCLRHQIDNLYYGLLSFLVDGSGITLILVSLITQSVFIQLPWENYRWIWIKNANLMV